MATEVLRPALHDETARVAIANVTRDEREPRLWVSIGERVGEQLVEAFARLATAYYGERP